MLLAVIIVDVDLGNESEFDEEKTSLNKLFEDDESEIFLLDSILDLLLLLF